MNRLINSLPIELYYHILSYSYKPQPVNLLKDIISYVRTKENILTRFNRRYHYTYITNKKEIYNHFTFHIHCFLTGMPNTYANCKNKKVEVCNRIYMHHKVRTEPQLTCCVFWGLLTVEEREQFVEIQKKMDLERMP